MVDPQLDAGGRAVHGIGRCTQHGQVAVGHPAAMELARSGDLEDVRFVMRSKRLKPRLPRDGGDALLEPRLELGMGVRGDELRLHGSPVGYSRFLTAMWFSTYVSTMCGEQAGVHRRAALPLLPQGSNGSGDPLERASVGTRQVTPQHRQNGA